MSSMVWCTPCLVVPPRCAQSVVWHRAIKSPGTIAVLGEWTTGPVLLYSRAIVACPHVLQLLTALHAHTSCRPMMALTSDVLEICVHVLGIRGPSCTGSPDRLFFMHVAHGPWGTAGHVTARSPPSREAGSRAIVDTADRSPPSGSRAMVHMAALDPFSLGRWVPEPWDT
jgi:hypothetical protein